METAHTKVALGCVPSTSVTNPQNVLPIAAGTSLITLSTLHYSDTKPEKITASER